MSGTKKRYVKDLANKWSFGITLTALMAFILWNLLIADYRNTTWVYYLIPVLLVSFVLAVIGMPLDKNNDKKSVVRSTISLVLSLVLVLLLGFIYISPLVFPFGIPPG
ncbi:hypothetical protein [Mesobacillus zeae]|uniref:hypothetical protein n=1 Tax=Mesobacillus zeae TaxID=1917180 RepID=UPI00300B39C2